jgi:hypothetical protein
MADLNGFDATQVEPAGSFAPIPAGQYPAVITDSEMKPTRSGNGSYLQLTFEILEGEHRGRKLWSRLNLDNPNPTAVAIAKAELSALCRAVGVMRPKDSVELHNLPMVIRVACRKRADTGEVISEIKGYSAKEASPDTGEMKFSNGNPPWKR